MGFTQEDLAASRFVKCDDLNGQPLTVTVAHVTKEALQQQDGSSKDKLIVHFSSGTRSLVLNQVNGRMMFSRLGPDTDGWSGSNIVLSPETTTMGGRVVPCIRVQVPIQKVELPQAVADFKVEAEVPDYAV